jgi:hypothetical protein
MKTALCLLTLAAVCAAVSGDDKGREAPKPLEASATARPATAEAELKWARGLVTEFLDGICHNETSEVLPLMLPESAKLYSESSFFRTWPTGYSSFSVTSAQLSPNQGEARFSGTLKGESKKTNFSLWLSKEPGGCWSTRYFKIRERESAASNGQGVKPPGPSSTAHETQKRAGRTAYRLSFTLRQIDKDDKDREQAAKDVFSFAEELNYKDAFSCAKRTSAFAVNVKGKLREQKSLIAVIDLSWEWKRIDSSTKSWCTNSSYNSVELPLDREVIIPHGSQDNENGKQELVAVVKLVKR